ncbi:MAG: nucleotide exchange factor GrpE [Thermoanaerobaculia bacterium]
MDRKKSDSGADDDAYVIEDTGETIEDIENEMKITADTAVEGLGADGAPVPAGSDPAAAEWKNRYMRTLADFENFRKRSEKEKQEFFKYALSGTLKEILPVLDNFDRALEHAEEGDDFHRGVLLIYKQLFDALKKAGLRPIEEVGVTFDPNIHEAVIREEDPSVPNHTVTAVLQKGYFLNDRLLRPALTKVAVGGSERNNDVGVH